MPEYQAIAEEFGIEFEEWEIGTVDGMAEICFATGKPHAALPVVVFEPDSGEQIQVSSPGSTRQHCLREREENG